ncbi:glycosyl transferase group 1 [Gemmatirosa kalamazoonensis]|uniref:Glycosyl transferase group 1 n=1 Tax=Gemmatirosa kalamazoonensis TaxID=861299 RepID=W0RG56_9BACT|nr:glycosyltransferase family 4 protein [Gemmatirosa kalamazoonensis]AHG88378.1 glycosyl transferase group 1 [Gemmatirosa kalamazoonensis]
MSALRVVQVGFHADAERRPAASLLRAWPTLSAVAGAASRAGIDVSVVQAAHRDESVAIGGVAYHFLDDGHHPPVRLPGGASVARRPARILRRVAELAPDVVHVHGLNHPLAARRLADSLGGIPVLVQDHGSVPPDGWRRHAWRWAYAPVVGVAFTAREQAAPFVDAGALRGDVPVFEVLESSTAFTPGDRDEARRATGMFGDPCLLWTGRLDANKDPLTVLDAFERALRELPEARLWCCFGHAPLLDAVRRRVVRSPALRGHVRLLGRRPHAEMELRFRAADFFVQASHREGSGYSLLEALACGTAPLVTDIPAARRIVGDAGSLTPVGDATALAAAMVAWAARAREPLRRAARARFEDALTFDAVGRELRTAYESVARA